MDAAAAGAPSALIAGKSLREWNDCWKPVTGGFKPKHPELRPYVGLARAVLNGQIVYIFRGTEHSKGGIEKSLQRIRGIEQTGNATSGPKAIRNQIDELELEVLLVGENKEAGEATKQLKRAMIKHLDPEWNRWHYFKLKRLRALKTDGR